MQYRFQERRVRGRDRLLVRDLLRDGGQQRPHEGQAARAGDVVEGFHQPVGWGFQAGPPRVAPGRDEVAGQQTAVVSGVDQQNGGLVPGFGRQLRAHPDDRQRRHRPERPGRSDEPLQHSQGLPPLASLGLKNQLGKVQAPLWVSLVVRRAEVW